MAKQAINAVFVGGILLLLLAGLARTVFFPKEVNSLEQRYAEQIAPLTGEGWLKGSFQDSVDKALSDQVQLSETYKKIYNTVSSRFLKAVSAPILSQCRDRYVNIAGTLMFNDNIVYAPFSLEEMAPSLDAKADNLNEYFAAHRSLDFYVYYLERDIDLDFETGERVGAREYFLDQLDLPEDRIACLRVDSFEEFSARYLRTDHHWNYAGAYQGYTELVKLLGVDEPALAPQGGPVQVGTLYGSRSTGMTSAFSETFYAYRFDYPDMEITDNGYPVDDYGRQNEFLSGNGDWLTYGGFYGWDEGEVHFDTNRPERENLLILGESYDNAVVKLLASHFNNTYAVDLRNYEPHLGKDFQFSDYVEEHDITKVLLIGCMTYFRMDEFALEG